jgi:hypothetical protein
VVGDGRRQWGTVQGAHTFGRDQSHLTDGLANTCTLMHLAAASLGLATQWVSIHIQEPFKKVLGVPDLMMLYLIIPVGYPAVEPSEGVRRPLEEIVHYDHYDESKFMSNERIIQFLYELRGKTLQTYRQSYVGKRTEGRLTQNVGDKCRSRCRSFSRLLPALWLFRHVSVVALSRALPRRAQRRPRIMASYGGELGYQAPLDGSRSKTLCQAGDQLGTDPIAGARAAAALFANAPKCRRAPVCLRWVDRAGGTQ